MSAQKNVEWLRHRTEQYQSTTNDMCEAIEDFDEVEKLGQGFSSVDPLEELDIGDGITLRPTFVNKNMSLEHKEAIIKLLRDYVDCFTWNYCEMLGLSRVLLEYQLPISLLGGLIQLFMIGLRRRWNDYSMQDSFDLTDMRSGFPTSYSWKRTPTKFGYV
jgi:hypothetical protein